MKNKAAIKGYDRNRFLRRVQQRVLTILISFLMVLKVYYRLKV